MARAKVNKSELIRNYLEGDLDQSPSALSKRIKAEKGVDVSADFISGVKGKLKREMKQGSSGKKKAGAKKAKAKPKAAPAAAPAKAAAAPKGRAVSDHIANLKSAALQLGKEQAKRIIDLF